MCILIGEGLLNTNTSRQDTKQKIKQRQTNKYLVIISHAQSGDPEHISE